MYAIRSYYAKSDLAAGYALACQTVVEGDVAIVVPPPEAIQRRLTTDQMAPEAAIPEGYAASDAQPVRRIALRLTAPSIRITSYNVCYTKLLRIG